MFNTCLLAALMIVAPFGAVVVFLGWRIYSRLSQLLDET